MVRYRAKARTRWFSIFALAYFGYGSKKFTSIDSLRFNFLHPLDTGVALKRLTLIHQICTNELMLRNQYFTPGSSTEAIGLISWFALCLSICTLSIRRLGGDSMWILVSLLYQRRRASKLSYVPSLVDIFPLDKHASAIPSGTSSRSLSQSRTTKFGDLSLSTLIFF